MAIELIGYDNYNVVDLRVTDGDANLYQGNFFADIKSVDGIICLSNSGGEKIEVSCIDGTLISVEGELLKDAAQSFLGSKIVSVAEVVDFDIAEYSSSRKDHGSVYLWDVDGDCIHLSDPVYLDRDDAIAIAKHFKLTGEDLK